MQQFFHHPPKRSKAPATAAAGPVFAPEHLPPVYTAVLADAVKHYQHRHGFTEDGILTPQTIESLNVPLTERVIQHQDSLERWRW